MTEPKSHTVIDKMHKLEKGKAIFPPSFLLGGLHYLTIGGSISYGCNTDTSDFDCVGFTIPPKRIVFPESAGYIRGFSDPEVFDVWQQHHVQDPDGIKRQYDFTVYNIVKYFRLCADNNPNMVDSLFTYDSEVLHRTGVSDYLRTHRTKFLHKGIKHKMSGYAYSQLHKIQTKTNTQSEARQQNIQKYGYDVKFAYHVVRLLLECEQVLETGNLDLKRDREIYKDIRNGNWTEQQIREFAESKEKRLNELYETSKAIPHSPDMKVLKQILLDCIEMFYGSISEAYKTEDVGLILELEGLLQKYKK